MTEPRGSRAPANSVARFLLSGWDSGVNTTHPTIDWNPASLRAFANSPAVRAVECPLERYPVEYALDEDGLRLSYDLGATLWTRGPAALGEYVASLFTGRAGVLARYRGKPVLEIRGDRLIYGDAEVSVSSIGALVIVESLALHRRSVHLVVDHAGAPLLVLARHARGGCRADAAESYLTMLDRHLRCGVWRILPDFAGERIQRVPPHFPKRRP